MIKLTNPINAIFARMNYVITFITMIAMILLSCRTSKENESMLCSSQLKSEIKSNWNFGKDVGYYQTNGIFVHRLDSIYKKCLVGKSKTEIIRFFGQPSCTNSFGGNFGARGTIEYLLAGCDSTQRSFMCSYYVFYLDSAQKVFMFELDGRGGSTYE